MCEQCEAAHSRHLENVAAPVTWRAGERVRVKATGETGIVVYVYSNGYTLLNLGRPVSGGLLNNDSTFGNAELA